MTRWKIIGGIGVSIGMLLAFAPAASARWILGNGPSNIDVTIDGPANTTTVCANRIRGRAGLSSSPIEGVPFVAPPGPYGTKVVEVFVSPTEDFAGATSEVGGIRLYTSGTLLTPVATQTTAELTAITPPESYDDPAYFSYAGGAFDIVPPANSIKPGDHIAIRIAGPTTFAQVAAIACTVTPPPPTGATIDILPGTSPNYVVPWINLPILPVRLFGSATFDVSTATGVKLGSASPTTLPGLLSSLTAIRDRNGDGFPDRDYYFNPARTGLRCTSKTAALTGISGTTPFSATDSVKPVLC